jgi:hypothetical protein
MQLSRFSCLHGVFVLQLDTEKLRENQETLSKLSTLLLETDFFIILKRL